MSESRKTQSRSWRRQYRLRAGEITKFCARDCELNDEERREAIKEHIVPELIRLATAAEINHDKFPEITADRRMDLKEQWDRIKGYFVTHRSIGRQDLFDENFKESELEFKQLLLNSFGPHDQLSIAIELSNAIVFLRYELMPLPSKGKKYELFKNLEKIENDLFRIESFSVYKILPLCLRLKKELDEFKDYVSGEGKHKSDISVYDKKVADSIEGHLPKVSRFIKEMQPDDDSGSRSLYSGLHHEGIFANESLGRHSTSSDEDEAFSLDEKSDSEESDQSISENEQSFAIKKLREMTKDLNEMVEDKGMPDIAKIMGYLNRFQKYNQALQPYDCSVEPNPDVQTVIFIFVMSEFKAALEDLIDYLKESDFRNEARPLFKKYQDLMDQDKNSSSESRPTLG